MSASGPWHSCGRDVRTSAFGGRADIDLCAAHVCLSKADKPILQVPFYRLARDLEPKFFVRSGAYLNTEACVLSATSCSGNWA